MASGLRSRNPNMAIVAPTNSRSPSYAVRKTTTTAQSITGGEDRFVKTRKLTPTTLRSRRRDVVTTAPVTENRIDETVTAGENLISSTTPAARTMRVPVSPARKRLSEQNVDTYNKQPKMNNLYRLDLQRSSFYTIFGLNYDFDEDNFKRLLDRAYSIIVKTYTHNENTDDNDAEFDEYSNDYKTILETAELGYAILKNETARSVYDRYFYAKNSSDYSLLRDRLRDFDVTLNSLIARKNALDLDVTRITENGGETIVELLRREFDKKVNSAPQLRSASLNRILITWTVHPDNVTNENIDEGIIRKRFSRYGHINGLMLCTNQKGCALLEFSTSAAVANALQNEQIFNVKELNRWAINAETRSALISINDKALNIEKQIKELVSNEGEIVTDDAALDFRVAAGADSSNYNNETDTLIMDII
ncbi:J-domain protein [Hemileuca sp. nucleopolyhedrovirus]|uniref:J-domain protein n=1 Tax=Hemileuca sp. nucleopolyhedrovirus TaxID=1367203 RepID=S5N361_9ABAC|nr:J-domain protein [Hemileuca sp. nucleopolyhedrovirus]AGR56790.1 J-domain protein [Hemileuca sp. nucleopolyhedrovirus]